MLDGRLAETSVRRAFTQMLEIADRLGDARVNERPLGPQTNAVAALVIHCCALTEFWLGHVAVGRPSDRDRESEFSRTAAVAELHTMVAATLGTVGADLDRVLGGDAPGDPVLRQFLPDGDESDAALVLHVLEEIYQHLGHMELAADALIDRDP